MSTYVIDVKPTCRVNREAMIRTDESVSDALLRKCPQAAIGSCIAAEFDVSIGIYIYLMIAGKADVLSGGKRVVIRSIRCGHVARTRKCDVACDTSRDVSL